MTPVLIVCAALLVLAFFAGCATAARAGAGDASILQTVFDKLLPADFVGNAELSHANQYFTIAIKAEHLRRAEGKWTWDRVEYERQSHFPIFSGLTWSSTGKVRLGPPQSGTSK